MARRQRWLWVGLGFWLVMVALWAATNRAVVAAAPQGLRRFTIMGDSWGYLMLDPFKAEFAQRGLGRIDVLQTSIPGSTADFWANNEGGVLDVIKELIRVDPARPTVYISLSGNDLLQRYPLEGEAVFTEVEADLRTIADELIATRADVRLILAGYDILNFGRSDFCQDAAQLIFGVTTPEQVNPIVLRLGTIQAEVADDYDQVTYVNLWGTLQGHPGEPDITQWSPEVWMADDDNDCIHLNQWGYRRFIDAMFDVLLGPD